MSVDYNSKTMTVVLWAELEALRAAVRPLIKIADAYDDNALDDEARKHWGVNDEFTDTVHPAEIELYTGRGGKRLLTLADCFAARDALRRF